SQLDRAEQRLRSPEAEPELHDLIRRDGWCGAVAHGCRPSWADTHPRSPFVRLTPGAIQPDETPLYGDATRRLHPKPGPGCAAVTRDRIREQRGVQGTTTG